MRYWAVSPVRNALAKRGVLIPGCHFESAETKSRRRWPAAHRHIGARPLRFPTNCTVDTEEIEPYPMHRIAR